MAKVFRCCELGVECKWEGTADTEEELMAKVAEHIADEHKMIQITDSIRLKVKAFIRDT